MPHVRGSLSASKNSAVVVAHPDDEVLWFCSQLHNVGRVIIVFRDDDDAPGMGDRRAQAMGELSYQPICLNVPEAGTFNAVDWHKPEIAPFGLHLNAEGVTRECAEAYAANFHSIQTLLADQLSGCDTVFTHNPWGEYGHPDHVQVHRAVASFRVQQGCSLWVSSYISGRARLLAQMYENPRVHEMLPCPVDPVLARNATRVYKKHGCWTWDDDWECSASEVFLRSPKLKETARTCG